MKAVLIDTNGYVAFKQGRADAIAVLQQASVIALNSVVLGELLSGFAVGTRTDANRRELALFLNSPRVVVLSIDQHTAEHYAAIYSSLRRAATPIPTNDMWIAASAFQHDMLLFSCDQHFLAVEGLRICRSASDFPAA